MGQDRHDGIMELKDLDLNLLRTLDELLRERNVTRAADKLGMTQAGMSNALSRLRLVLGDELLLRTGRGMQPTPYAESITEALSEALQQLHDVLNTRVAFDPLTSDRAFTLAMTDIGEIEYLPRLMNEIGRTAPRISISTVRKREADLKDDLETGNADLAMGWLPDLNTGMFQRKLGGSQYVCAFRKGHPFDKGGITKDEYASADHVVVIAASTGHMLIQRAIEQRHFEGNVRLRVPHFAAVASILGETDLVATLPLRLVNRHELPFHLSWVPLPFEIDPIPLAIFWSARYHRDPANQWLRRTIVRLFGQDAP